MVVSKVVDLVEYIVRSSELVLEYTLDKAMTLFLACLKDFAEFAKSKDQENNIPPEKCFNFHTRLKMTKCKTIPSLKALISRKTGQKFSSTRASGKARPARQKRALWRAGPPRPA
ncbi:hypothetical protein Ahy_B04g073137 [Arachis hypogaea]|uniref:Uncharacterized protein n=1 Tax=Arachis hypogaea TaxID=3818 RepID=A0A444ZPX4_ARAHY|nr:hypothetical protein Ahy_B04g073137 [Arachis hypogaea]